MKLPELQPIKTNTVALDVFNGINDNIFTPEGYFKDMKNMSSDYYPALSQRKIRQQYKLGGNINGAITINGNLYTIIGTKMYKNGTVVSGVSVTDSQKQLVGYGAYVVIMPDKIMYNTQNNTTKKMSYTRKVDLSTEGIEASGIRISKLYISDEDGNPYVVMGLTSDNIPTKTDGDERIKNFINTTKKGWPDYVSTINCLIGTKSLVKAYMGEWGGKYKLGFCPITSDHKITFEYYNDSMNTWTSPKLYVTYFIELNTEAQAQEMTSAIVKGDFIKLEVCNKDGKTVSSSAVGRTTYNFYQKFSGIKVESVRRSGKQVAFVFSNTSIDYLNYIKKNGDYTVGNYSVDSGGGSSGSPKLQSCVNTMRDRYTMPNLEKSNDYCVLNIKKDMPDMNYITVSENRIWGCSNSKHEIYACKQGDPTNWYSYAGLSNDSYAVTIGSDGDFTGCCTYKGMPYFFKDNLIIAIYGSKPSNYQTSEIYYSGIEKGSSNSIFYLNGIMYFKSRRGIVKFDGNSISVISEELGRKTFKNAIGCATDSKYIVSMSEDGKYRLFVYDSEKNMWHIEDDLRPDFFFKYGASVYGVKRTGQMIYRIDGADDISGKLPYATQSNEIEQYTTVDGIKLYNRGLSWYADTGEIEKGSINAKYIQRLGIRFSLEPLAYLTVKVKYDNDEEWKEIYTHESKKDEGPVSIAFRPYRCTKFRLRFEGEGRCIIHNIQREVYEGSDLRNGNI